MKILQVIGTLDPAYGGPVEGLRQIVPPLRRIGVESETLTLDAPGAVGADRIDGVVHAIGPSAGKYRYNAGLVPWLMEHGRNYEALIACGIWQQQSLAVRTAARKLGIPYFVFVHGAMDPWFKTAYPLKHIKKWLYWNLFEYAVLRDAAAVLYCSEEEAVLASQYFSRYSAHPAVVDNGVAAPIGDAETQKAAFHAQFPELRGHRIMLFLSRIHTKKGCDLLIEACAQIGQWPDDLRIVIAGPDEEGLQGRLQQRVEALGISSRIHWVGMLTGDCKWGAIRNAEVFVLPSHSENFGIAVVEALACRVPVLITDKINIWRPIDAAGAGFVETDTVEGTVNLLQRWLGLDDTQRAEMTQRAVDCFNDHFEISISARKLAGAIRSKGRLPDG